MIGETISHYRILEKLGEGGMGVVYKAEDTKLKRTVALKFLPPELTRAAEWKERFLREAQAAAVLDHPNICTLYETYEIEGQIFLAMAYVEGQSLQEKIGSVPLSTDEAVRIAIQVAEGLQEAHEKGIIHRDIKSTNIMVTEKGRAKIMDFGLAKFLGRTKLTDSATVMGTVDYMSPEQARGEPVDHRADIWSLGVVLYEMLAGRTPFEGTSDAALVHKIIYEEPPELSSLAPDVPAGLSTVVSQAMAKEKEERYASVAEFLEDLRNYESLPPEKLIPPKRSSGTRAMSTARPSARKRFKRGITAAAVAALVCLGIALVWVLRKPGAVPPAEPAKVEQQIRYCRSADGTRIAYAALGKGRPLVRVLGWFTHLEYEWNHPMTRAWIDANAARYLSVRYDARGMGLSEHNVSDFSLEAQVADLEAVVDDLKLERFALFGLSQGGPVAITYTVRHPERVSHLLLYGSYDHWWYMDTEEGQQEFEALITLVREGWDSDAPAHRQFFTGMFVPDATEMKVIQWFNELQRISTSADNAAALGLTFPNLDVRHLLPQVKVPTLVIHRRGDTAVPFEMGKKLAMSIPKARFLPLAGRNHTMMAYEPEAQIMAKAVAEFLAEDFEATAKAEPLSQEKSYSSIAVLPFDDMSEAKDQEYFCDGIVEEIVNALTQIKDFRVIARTSAFAFKGKEVDVRDIGKQLNVETVLEGSVRKSGNRVRITAQLVDVANGFHLWSERYDRELKDIFALQDEITQAIVDNLQVTLSEGERPTLAKRRVADLEAYDLYLRGRYFWNQLGAERLRKAIDHFERAIEKDPSYAEAYAGLADCYVVLRVENPLLSEEETYAKAREIALKALEIDDTVPEVHVSLGILKNGTYEWEGAEKEFRRAIELSPGSAFAHYAYSWQLMWKGRFDEAIREINRARELDPLSLLINKQVGVIFLNARRYDEAIEAERRTLEIAPNLPYARSVIAAAYLQKSMYEEALAEYEKERELYEVWNPMVDSWIGITYARMGKRAEAQKILDEMVERSKEGYVTPTALGNLYLELGEYDEAFQWLGKAYEDHDFWLSYLKVDLLYDNVRSDPRYIALLKKMGLDK